MSRVCVPQFVSISIGSQRSEARGCANGYPEGDLIHIAMLSLTVKAVLEVVSTSLQVRLDGASLTETESRRFKAHNR
jgi:hypothetical protein